MAMQTSGMAITGIKRFLNENYDEEEFAQWLGRLSVQAREVYSKRISPTGWFPTTSVYMKPMSLIADMFFNGDVEQAGHTYGSFSASFALNRLYGLSGFILGRGGPIDFLKRGNRVLSMYNKPCRMETEVVGKNSVVGRLEEFEELTRMYEHVILGFSKKGLEITGTQDVTAEIKQSILDGFDHSEYYITWQ